MQGGRDLGDPPALPGPVEGRVGDRASPRAGFSPRMEAPLSLGRSGLSLMEALLRELEPHEPTA